MISNKSYKELYEILSYMDKMTVMKIPMNVLIDIKNSDEHRQPSGQRIIATSILSHFK